jgi:hypothetical protein
VQREALGRCRPMLIGIRWPVPPSKPVALSPGGPLFLAVKPMIGPLALKKTLGQVSAIGINRNVIIRR